MSGAMKNIYKTSAITNFKYFYIFFCFCVIVQVQVSDDYQASKIRKKESCPAPPVSRGGLKISGHRLTSSNGKTMEILFCFFFFSATAQSPRRSQKQARIADRIFQLFLIFQPKSFLTFYEKSLQANILYCVFFDDITLA